MRRPLTYFGLALCLAFATNVWADNIVLTGHDDDFHEQFGPGLGAANPAGQQLLDAINFARAGAANPLLPVLTIDQVSSFAGYMELDAALNDLGVSYVNVDPSAAGPIDATVFDPTKYSAIVIASDQSCGGCDLTTASEAKLAADSAAITAFADAGGGIVALSGAENASTYYNFLPQTASGFGIPPTNGYSQTAAGAAAGIPAVNNDETHNFFYAPGTNGVSSAYQVAEINTSIDSTGATVVNDETLVCTGCTISNGTITSGTDVPEPGSIAVSGLGLLALALVRKRMPGRTQ